VYIHWKEEMSDNDIERVKKYLQDKEVQERVTKRMNDARSKATVTISKAAGLFEFSEIQLREWEKRGLLKSERTTLPEDSKTSKGHRQFSPDELDKLALIKELMDRGYTISDIPQNVDDIWQQVKGGKNGQISANGDHEIKYIPTSERVPVDKLVETAEEEHFWRFFISQALRLTLLLICEEMPGTIAGIFLPFEHKEPGLNIDSPQDISKIGPALVGWIGANQAFYAFFESDPTFDYPSDFRIEHLNGWDKNICPAPIFVIQRKSRPIAVTEIQVASIQRILSLIYAHVNEWLQYFGYGRRDWIEFTTNFGLNQNVTDGLLDRMMNTIVELGGEEFGSMRWKFCNLFLPEDSSLPMQQRIIRVRAHSSQSPASLSSTILTVARPGLTYRAYQSGQVFYRHHMTPKDTLLAYTDIEESTRSAIAIPLSGYDGMIAAAIYIASEQPNAFSLIDQSALRLMTRMLEELLATYQARLFVSGKMSEALIRPKIVDNSFREFLSEEDFIDEFEKLLNDILEQGDETQLEGKEVSFIVLDIDKQTPVAIKYGDRAARNLSHEVGVKLQGRLKVQSNPEFRRVYHVGADQYFLKLPEMSLEDARNLAEKLRQLLRGNYSVDVRRPMAGRPALPDELLVLPNVTVRLGVSNYTFLKLKEVLGRYKVGGAVAETRTLILNNFLQSLKIGQDNKGDCIVSWDHDTWGYNIWSNGEPTS
jgi:DNA-binding transcriptional MerR regulator/GGDEF domain-containing protein